MSTDPRGVRLVYDCVSAVYHRVVSPCRFFCYAIAAKRSIAAVSMWCRKVIECVTSMRGKGKSDDKMMLNLSLICSKQIRYLRTKWWKAARFGKIGAFPTYSGVGLEVHHSIFRVFSYCHNHFQQLLGTPRAAACFGCFANGLTSSVCWMDKRTMKSNVQVMWKQTNVYTFIH